MFGIGKKDLLVTLHFTVKHSCLFKPVKFLADGVG
jgi:hypothetical protein